MKNPKNRNSSQKVKDSKKKQKPPLNKNQSQKKKKIAKESVDKVAKKPEPITEKEDIIVLSHLQNRKYYNGDMYLPSQYILDEESEKQRQKDKALREKEKRKKMKSHGSSFTPTYIKDENIEKDNIIKTESFIKISLDTYYKIEKDKNDELQKIFGQSKLKTQLKNINIISDDKIFTLDNLKKLQQSPQLNNAFNMNMMNMNMNRMNMNMMNMNMNMMNNNMMNNNMMNNNNLSKIDNELESDKQKIKIYDNNQFKLLNEIELQKKDMICFQESKLSAFELDNKDLIISSYDNSLSINIYRYENNNYILIQNIGKISNLYYSSEIPFIPNKKRIQKLSGNRFMTISNVEMNIYSLNKNNMYEVILSHKCEGIEDIYEIDTNDFIICTLTRTENNNVYQNYNDIHAYHQSYDYTYKINKIKFDNNKKPSSEVLFRETREFNSIHSSEYIILKKKYFIIFIEENLYIFSIENGKILKKYKILENGEKNTNLYKIKNCDIFKWNCSDDDEFIIHLNGNITLFKIEEEKNEIKNLKIVGYSYFKDIKDLKRMKKDNQFYVQSDDYTLIY